MKNNQYSAEFLQQIRKTLPRGGQKEISKRLINSGHKASQRDIHRALLGYSLTYPKPAISLIIKTAEDIIKEVSGIENVNSCQINTNNTTAN